MSWRTWLGAAGGPAALEGVRAASWSTATTLWELRCDRMLTFSTAGMLLLLLLWFVYANLPLRCRPDMTRDPELVRPSPLRARPAKCARSAAWSRNCSPANAARRSTDSPRLWRRPEAGAGFCCGEMPALPLAARVMPAALLAPAPAPAPAPPTAPAAAPRNLWWGSSRRTAGRRNCARASSPARMEGDAWGVAVVGVASGLSSPCHSLTSSTRSCGASTPAGRLSSRSDPDSDSASTPEVSSSSLDEKARLRAVTGASGASEGSRMESQGGRWPPRTS